MAIGEGKEIINPIETAQKSNVNTQQEESKASHNQVSARRFESNITGSKQVSENGVSIQF